MSPIHTDRSKNDIENTEPTICLANVLPFVDPGAANKKDAGNYMNQGIRLLLGLSMRPDLSGS